MSHLLYQLQGVLILGVMLWGIPVGLALLGRVTISVLTWLDV